ncbi:MAG TPA: hypothetical protein VEM41_06420 [Actinomycetota bacterium]|nr:hypothetical protein [Actinomycetota bacterium]
MAPDHFASDANPEPHRPPADPESIVLPDPAAGSSDLPPTGDLPLAEGLTDPAWSPHAARRLRHETSHRAIGSRPSVQHAGVLALYGLLSLALFGPKVLHDFGTRFIAKVPMDAAIFMWSLRWWPYALAHHLNPLYTKLVWAPGGMNLAWTTTPPVPSMLMAPITLWFGPVVAFNVLTLLTPAVTSWTAYLLCRRLTRNAWASIVGGFAFGFSVAVLAQFAQGHPNFSLAAMVPLAAYWVVRYLEGSLSPRAFVVLLALTVLVEFGISTEVTATMTFFAAVAWALGILFAGREWRIRLARLAGLAAIAYVLAVLFATPWLYVAFHYPRPELTIQNELSIRAFAHQWTALAEAVLPGNKIVAGNVWPLQTTRSGNVLYLGVPLLIILTHLLVTQWRNAAVRALAITFVFVFACSFGSGLIVGHHVYPTPFRLLQSLPLLKLILPDRPLIYCALIAAVGVAVWLALVPRQWWRWALAALAVITTLPNLAVTPAVATVPSWPLFTSGDYRTVLSPSNAVLMVTGPGWAGGVRRGDTMIWQAKSGMYFTLAGGFLGTVRPQGADGELTKSLDMDTYRSNDPGAVTALLQRLGVTSVVAIGRPPQAVRRLCQVLDVVPETTDGVAIFRGPFETPGASRPRVTCP